VTALVLGLASAMGSGRERRVLPPSSERAPTQSRPPSRARSRLSAKAAMSSISMLSQNRRRLDKCTNTWSDLPPVVPEGQSLPAGVEGIALHCGSSATDRLVRSDARSISATRPKACQGAICDCTRGRCRGFCFFAPTHQVTAGEIRKFPEPAVCSILQISPSSRILPPARSRSASG